MAKILVIDDDERIRMFLRTTLERADYTVVEAREGTEGLDRCRQMSIDVVITDLLMPGKEGLETVSQLRREWPSMKVIAISGGGSTGVFAYLDVAQKLGADRTLSKPFNRETLLSVVRDVLEPSA